MRRLSDKTVAKWSVWVLVVLASMGSVAVALAETGAARAALDLWVERVNGAPSEELEAYLGAAFTEEFQAQVPMDQAVAFHQQIKSAGELSVHSVEDEQQGSLTALLATAGGTWLRAQLSVSGAPPKISGLLLQPAEAPQSNGAEDSGSIDWETLDQLAQHFVDQSGLPAVAIAWVRPGEQPHLGVAGVRAVGTEDRILPEDKFHIGSITKSVTATVLARLVEQGKLSWQAKLGDLLPGDAKNTAFADVELQTVLRHSARIPQHLTFDGPEMARLNGLAGSATQQRAAYVKEILQLDPIADGFRYSNAGYAVAGHVGELASGRPWEQLVEEEVFAPLGLDSCGVGWPATPDRKEQPRGHFGVGPQIRTQRLDEYVLGAFMAPAGNVHCSIKDLALYGLAHLNGLEGNDGFLRADTVKELHRVGDKGQYAAGWGVDPESGQHQHNGSAGTFFSYLVIDPEARVVVAFLTNGGPQRGQQAAREAVAEVVASLE